MRSESPSIDSIASEYAESCRDSASPWCSAPPPLPGAPPLPQPLLPMAPLPPPPPMPSSSASPARMPLPSRSSRRSSCAPPAPDVMKSISVLLRRRWWPPPPPPLPPLPGPLPPPPPPPCALPGSRCARSSPWLSTSSCCASAGSSMWSCRPPCKAPPLPPCAAAAAAPMPPARPLPMSGLAVPLLPPPPPWPPSPPSRGAYEEYMLSCASSCAWCARAGGGGEYMPNWSSDACCCCCCGGGSSIAPPPPPAAGPHLRAATTRVGREVVQHVDAGDLVVRAALRRRRRGRRRRRCGGGGVAEVLVVALRGRRRVHGIVLLLRRRRRRDVVLVVLRRRRRQVRRCRRCGGRARREEAGDATARLAAYLRALEKARGAHDGRPHLADDGADVARGAARVVQVQLERRAGRGQAARPLRRRRRVLRALHRRVHARVRRREPQQEREARRDERRVPAERQRARRVGARVQQRGHAAQCRRRVAAAPEHDEQEGVQRRAEERGEALATRRVERRRARAELAAVDVRERVPRDGLHEVLRGAAAAAARKGGGGGGAALSSRGACAQSLPLRVVCKRHRTRNCNRLRDAAPRRARIHCAPPSTSERGHRPRCLRRACTVRIYRDQAYITATHAQVQQRLRAWRSMRQRVQRQRAAAARAAFRGGDTLLTTQNASSRLYTTRDTQVLEHRTRAPKLARTLRPPPRAPLTVMSASTHEMVCSARDRGGSSASYSRHPHTRRASPPHPPLRQHRTRELTPALTVMSASTHEMVCSARSSGGSSASKTHHRRMRHVSPAPLTVMSASTHEMKASMQSTAAASGEGVENSALRCARAAEWYWSATRLLRMSAPIASAAASCACATLEGTAFGDGARSRSAIASATARSSQNGSSLATVVRYECRNSFSSFTCSAGGITPPACCATAAPPPPPPPLPRRSGRAAAPPRRGLLWCATGDSEPVAVGECCCGGGACRAAERCCCCCGGGDSEAVRLRPAPGERPPSRAPRTTLGLGPVFSL
ncbi:hypothetical protein JKP88DRAFT_267591 [Tribonema minus]|uniref:Uncharacterized protein n=1 Tax=Tribonema minus TaxID=303371 RepID=A0A836CK43_9STRA|nr:hypothetical protein JKP88DRAFT_267591 [Tribonema minus]